MQIVDPNALSCMRGLPSCLPGSQARTSGFMMSDMVLPRHHLTVRKRCMHPTSRKQDCPLTSFEALDCFLASPCCLGNNLAKAHISQVANKALVHSRPFDSTEHLLVQTQASRSSLAPDARADTAPAATSSRSPTACRLAALQAVL